MLIKNNSSNIAPNLKNKTIYALNNPLHHLVQNIAKKPYLVYYKKEYIELWIKGNLYGRNC